MKKHWLVGTVLVWAAGCEAILEIDPAPALEEIQPCREWKCTGKTCEFENYEPGTPCSNNGQCDANGECKKNTGETCSLAMECISGFCPEKAGRCCDSACTADGETCGQDGHCKRGNGTPCSDATGCLQGFCFDGVCCNEDCSGRCKTCKSGTCRDVDKGQQDPLTCAAKGEMCDGEGACVREKGEACANDRDCQSVHCVDGFCCDDTCEGWCKACSAEKKGGGSNGECGYVVPNVDKDNECEYGACNGAGACKSDNGEACTQDGDCLSLHCVDGVCCNDACAGTCQACNLENTRGICSNVPFGQDDGDTCSATGKSCNGAGACKKDNGHTCTTNTDCIGNVCYGAVCLGRSCDGLAANCSFGNCCTSIQLPAGSYKRAQAYPATVSVFRLDMFEVTVGRFRKFVDQYPASKPSIGAGAHLLIANSGWQTGWVLPMDQRALKEELKQCALQSTWTDDPAANETRPINCVSWELAFAFCAWDGNRLPTESEWNYAAATGPNQKAYPWAYNEADIGYGNAVFDCARDGDTNTCILASLPSVGSTGSSGANFWGNGDLAGSVAEWTLDLAGAYPTTCEDCANLTDGTQHVLRGGSWKSPWDKSVPNAWKVPQLTSWRRSPATDPSTFGIRCAR